MSYYNRNCDCPCPGYAGYGYAGYGAAPYYGAYAPLSGLRPIHGRAMGAIGAGKSGSDPEIRKTFNCEAVWADAQKGASIGQLRAAAQLNNCNLSTGAPPSDATAGVQTFCIENWRQQGAANVAGLRALDMIRRALNELGYGPLATGGAISSADKEAWNKYTADKSVTSPFVSKPGICALETDLKGGAKGAKGSSAAVAWMVALVAGGAATVAVLAGKKKAGVASAKAIVPVRG